MLKYEDVAKMARQGTFATQFCATCGKNLKFTIDFTVDSNFTINSKRTYIFCSRCKVITYYIER